MDVCNCNYVKLRKIFSFSAWVNDRVVKLLVRLFCVNFYVNLMVNVKLKAYVTVLKVIVMHFVNYVMVYLYM